MKTRNALILYGIVVSTLGLMLTWWCIFLLRQGDLLVERATRAGAELSQEQATAVREAAHQSLRMFLYEGGFLLLVFVAGVLLMVRAMRREVRLARQQREFLSAVTHELRTPLSSARLALQSLVLGRVGPEKQPRYLANASADLARLSELVERVLESSRVSTKRARVSLERMDLAEFVTSRAGPLASEAAPGLELERVSSGPVLVSADAGALETILRNLLANAAKYAAAGGRVQVRAERAGSEARLVVRDFGPGASGAADKLFDPFVRGDGPLVKSRPGVGLGLYLVAELVRAQGGRVSARNSEDGCGFEVTVGLPVMSETPGASDA